MTTRFVIAAQKKRANCSKLFSPSSGAVPFKPKALETLHQETCLVSWREIGLVCGPEGWLGDDVEFLDLSAVETTLLPSKNTIVSSRKTQARAPGRPSVSPDRTPGSASQSRGPIAAVIQSRKSVKKGSSYGLPEPSDQIRKTNVSSFEQTR